MSKKPIDEMISIGDIASAATATAYHPTLPAGQTPTKVNFQLDEWLEAKRLYAEAAAQPSVNVGQLLPIVNRLGNSLAILFGHQHTAAGHAPALREYITKDFIAKGWNLQNDDSALYRAFLELDSDYKDLTKHLSAGKVANLSQLTFERTREHMETARKTWLWFLRKRAQGATVLPDQEMHFKSIL